MDPDLWSKGLVERTHFTPEGTVTATPLHHLYHIDHLTDSSNHITDENDDDTLSMSELKGFRRRVTESERFRTQMSDREYCKMTLCSMYFLPNLNSRTLLRSLAPLLAQ